jgi:D-threonate/D-erythronate kinase
MSADWLILADDLTGAADAAVAFARRGCVTEVTWGATAIAGDMTVHARDLGSRALSAAEAAERHREAFERQRATARPSIAGMSPVSGCSRRSTRRCAVSPRRK